MGVAYSPETLNMLEKAIYPRDKKKSLKLAAGNLQMTSHIIGCTSEGLRRPRVRAAHTH